MAKKLYLKASKGRDYDYDRARGSYSRVRKNQANCPVTFLMPDTDDHGRFAAPAEPPESGDGESGNVAEESERHAERRLDDAREVTIERLLDNIQERNVSTYRQ